jgi:cation diffusion facilitator family transporter
MSELASKIARGERAAQAGVVTNLSLAMVKFIAGVLGHSYALVADAIESAADVFSSLIVWGGLRLSAREADERYPFGYGKAEPLAALAVAFMLLGAAAGIAIQAVREIVTPHHGPAPFTLVVLIAVVVTKEILFRRVFRVGEAVASTAVRADAWHHRSDALTSLAAAIGISVALAGGPGWESADDWAALAAAAVIAWNGVRTFREAARDLMDRAPRGDLMTRVASAASRVGGVRDIHKLKIRRAGLGIYVDLHVQADPGMTLHDAHILSGMVKSAIRESVPETLGVLVHMEPFEHDEARDTGRNPPPSSRA